MWKYFIKYPGYTDWFNNSWFASSASPAFTRPQRGYVPPPLDGVWITAPYLHNGSVPTIENVLNSKTRPRYWKRNFNKDEYDYDKLGCRYKALSKPGGKRTYNTNIPGYGNYGHYFGDHLTGKQRKAVIEYLKTLWFSSKLLSRYICQWLRVIPAFYLQNQKKSRRQRL